MNLLVITGLYPTKLAPEGGIFLSKRLEQYIKKGININVISVAIEDGKVVSFIKRIIKRTRAQSNHIIENKDLNWRAIIVKRNLLHVFDKKSLEKLIVRTIMKKIGNILSFDLISAHWAYPDGLYALSLSKKLKIPYVLTLHGSDVHSNPLNNSIILEKTKMVIDNAACCIFVSNKLKDIATKLGFEPSDSKVIYNGYDSNIFIPIDKRVAKEKIGIKTSKLVGFVGNIIDVKNVLVLPEIFLSIQSESEDVSFVVVGEGNLRGQLERECNDLDINCIFTGRLEQTEVAMYMQAMDVLVLPSKKEGFGAVLVEAQACGTYVVGSDAGGIPEAIGNKEQVFSLENDFVNKVSTHLIDILEDDFRDNNVQNSKIGTWEYIVDQEISIFKRLIKYDNND